MPSKDSNSKVPDVNNNTIEEQIKGQQAFNLNGEIYEETEDKPPDIKNQDDDGVLGLIKGDKFDIRYFHEKFENNSEELLYELMALQDNSAPLKKGGPEISYRCDAFILKNRQAYTAAENTVFDIITGYVSSFPSDKTYVIYMKDIQKILGTNSEDKYLYRVIKDGVDGLKKKPLEFEYTDNRKKKRTLATPWYRLLTYDKEIDGEMAYISFTPMPLFKALTISATVTHGAYYSSKVSARIQTKLTRSLYYFLESRKNYKAYPNARAGDFKISVEEFKNILGLAKSYKYGNIKERVLDRAQEDFTDIEGMDFDFTYEPVYHGKRVDSIHFVINKIVAEVVSDNGGKAIEQNDLLIEREYLKDSDYSEKEIDDILKKYTANNRDRKYLLKVIKYVDGYKNAKNKTALMCKFMDEDLNEIQPSENNKKNSFNDFPQRKYSNEELEQFLKNKSKL